MDFMEWAAFFIQWILHLDASLPLFFTQYGDWLYLLLIAIIFAETGLVFFPFLPGDSLLFAAGALCAISSLDIGLLWVALSLAAIAGDALNYWIGRSFGDTIQASKRRIINPRHIEATQVYFKKHGGKAVILARFQPIIRTFMPFVAGIGHMPYRTFTVYNITGGIIWVCSFLGMGYFLGQLEIVKSHFSLVVLTIIILSFLPLGWDGARYINHKLKRKEV